MKSLAGEPCRLQTDVAQPLRIAAGAKEVSIKHLDDNLYDITLKKGEEVVLAGVQSTDSAFAIEPLPQQVDAKRWGVPDPAKPKVIR